MKQLFFDLETTGVDYIKNGIHQISGMIVIDDEIKEDFNFKVQPHKGDIVSNEALAVAGVTLEAIRQYPPVMEVYAEFISLLQKYVDKYDKQDKFFLCGYNNASFDTPFLRQWFEKCGDKYFGSWFWSHSIDVIVLAGERLKKERHLMPNFQLRTVAARCGIEVDETKLHDAMYDVSLTKLIYDSIQ
jgi:DNA polymerase-3 subunit epsilon